MFNNLKWWVSMSLFHKQSISKWNPACVRGPPWVSGIYENIWKTTLVTDRHIIQVTSCYFSFLHWASILFKVMLKCCPCIFQVVPKYCSSVVHLVPKLPKVVTKLFQLVLYWCSCSFQMVSKLSQVLPKWCLCCSKVVPSCLHLSNHVAKRCVEWLPLILL